MPVYDLQIHPRDHELIAATHGRSLWITDIAALEQVTPKVVAQGTYLFAPKVAYAWGEPPQMALPGNGYGQSEMTYANPPYGADIVYRLASAAPANVALIVSNVAGDTLARLSGPGAAGVHHVTWNFMSAVRRNAVLSPSQRRDSILLAVRAPMVLDSLAKAGYDSNAINTVRTQVRVLTNPGGLGGALGGRGGGGGRGGAPGVQACEHPTTQWEQFCARPAERAAGRGGPGAQFGVDSATAAAFGVGGNAPAPAAAPARGGRGARQAATGEPIDPIGRIWTLIGMPAPATGGRGGGGGGGFGGGAGQAQANTGDYLVTMTVNGQTYKQTFRVEKISGDGDTGFSFGQKK